MTDQQTYLCQRLQRLGFTNGIQMKLYGQVFDFIGEPIVLGDDLVLVDAKDKRTGQARRVRIPLPIVHMASRSHIAA